MERTASSKSSSKTVVRTSEGRQTRAQTRAMETSKRPATRSTNTKSIIKANVDSAKKTLRKTAITPGRVKRPETDSQAGLKFEPDSKALNSILNHTGVDGAISAPSVRQTLAGGSVSKTSSNNSTGPRFSIYNNPNRYTLSSRPSMIEAKRVPNSAQRTQPSPCIRQSNTPNRQSLYNNKPPMKPKTPLTAARVPVKRRNESQYVVPNTAPANKRWGDILQSGTRSKDSLAKVLFNDGTDSGSSPHLKAASIKQTPESKKSVAVGERESNMKSAADIQHIQKLEHNRHCDKENAGSPLRLQKKTIGSNGSSPRQPLSPANNRANILASNSPNPTSPLVMKNSPLHKENINDMVKLITTLSSDSGFMNSDCMTTIARSIHDDIVPLSPLARSRSKQTHSNIAKSLFEESDSVFHIPTDVSISGCMKCPGLEKRMQMQLKELTNYKKQCANLQSKVQALEMKICEKDSAIGSLERCVKQKECDLLHKERIMWQDREKFVLQMEKAEMQDQVMTEHKETIKRLHSRLAEKDKEIEEHNNTIRSQEKSLNEGLACVSELKEQLKALKSEMSDESGEELDHILSGTRQNSGTMVICEGGVVQNVKLQKDGCSPKDNNANVFTSIPEDSSPILCVQSSPEVSFAESCCSPAVLTPIHNTPAHVAANYGSPCLYTRQNFAGNTVTPIKTSLTSSANTPRISSRPAYSVLRISPLTPAQTRPLCNVDRLPGTPTTQLLRVPSDRAIRPTPIPGPESVRKKTLFRKALVSHASMKYQDCLLDEEVMLYMVKTSAANDTSECDKKTTERRNMLKNPIGKLFEFKESRQFQPIEDEKFTPSPPKPAFSAPSAFSTYKRLCASVH